MKTIKFTESMEELFNEGKQAYIDWSKEYFPSETLSDTQVISLALMAFKNLYKQN